MVIFSDEKPGFTFANFLPLTHSAMSSHVKFEKECVGAMMMPYGQKPRTVSLIEPASMAKIESMIEKRVDGKYCTNCGYTSKNSGHMKEHVEKHIEGLEYYCNICDKIMR